MNRTLRSLIPIAETTWSYFTADLVSGIALNAVYIYLRSLAAIILKPVHSCIVPFFMVFAPHLLYLCAHSLYEKDIP